MDVLILGTISSSPSQCPGSACPEVVHLLGRKTGGIASPLEWPFGGGKEAVRLGTPKVMSLRQKSSWMWPREGVGFSGIGDPVHFYFSLSLCSLNWPCRSNSPRHWQPASCPVRCPPQLLPSVPCRGPWPSGLLQQQRLPSSQLLSWAQLCSVLQRELSALLQGPSFSLPISGPRMATSYLFLAGTCLHIPEIAFCSFWVSTQAGVPASYSDWGFSSPLGLRTVTILLSWTSPGLPASMAP